MSTEPAWHEARILGDHDCAAAADVLARGFMNEPGNLALLPNEERRRTLLAATAPRLLRSALRRGTAHGVDVDSDLAAVAVWQPPGTPSISARGLRDGLIDYMLNTRVLAQAAPDAATVLARHARRLPGLVRARQRAAATASAGLTWHLSFLATLPEYRGKGLARQLLERQLTRCDQDKTAAWLETTDPANLPIYHRFGFATVAHIDDAAWLPGIWIMRRDPTPAGHHTDSIST